jgi:hypothetical protein
MLRVSENMVLRRIFKRCEVLGGCRKLFNEMLHNLNSLPKQLEWSSEGR